MSYANKKDYCDYDTCVALEELGFPIRGIKVKGEEKHVPILLYEAQKFLKEENGIIVDVRYGGIYYNVVLADRITGGRVIIKDKDNRIADFERYELALNEGIKETIRLLKEEK